MSEKNLAQIKAQIRQCKQRPKLESQINCLQELFFKTNNYLVTLEIGHLLRQFHPNEAKVYYEQAVEIAPDEETKENIKKKIQEISEKEGHISVRLNFRDLSLSFPTVSTPIGHHFRRALKEAFQAAKNAGADYLVVKAGDLHRHVGGYPGHNHRMPVCCEVMRSFLCCYKGEILNEPPKGNGASLEIEYDLRARKERFQKPAEGESAIAAGGMVVGIISGALLGGVPGAVIGGITGAVVGTILGKSCYSRADSNSGREGGDDKRSSSI